MTVVANKAVESYVVKLSPSSPFSSLLYSYSTSSSIFLG